MNTKYIVFTIGIVLIIVFIFNRSNVEDSNKNDKMENENIAYLFNNNSDGCIPSEKAMPPNSQRFWDYLSQHETSQINGQVLFHLSETYDALARLVSAMHLDLYDDPVYDKAHPVFPISQLFSKNKNVDKMMKFEQSVTLNGNEAHKLGNDIDGNPIKSSRIKNIIEVDDYYFADTKNILGYAKWARSESRQKLFQYLINQSEPNPDAYRSWLLLIRMDNTSLFELERLDLHATYINGIKDSLLSETSPLGLMFDAMPEMLKNDWLNIDDVVKTLNDYDQEFAEDMVPLITMLTGDEKKIENLLRADLANLKIFEYPDFSGRFIDQVCNYYYKTGEYEKAMVEITRFWYDDMKNHPMENLCFDNYPAFLLRSYLFGRWDGARLPLFLQDYRNVVGSDPVLKNGFEFLQRYNSEISKTFENTIN